MIKSLLKRAAAAKGLELVKKSERRGESGFQGALRRMAARNIPISTVIDIGASDGQWADPMMRIYPNAKYFLIEAQPCHEAALKTFCAQRPNAEFILAAAGESEGEIFFDATAPLGGRASTTPIEKNGIRVPVTTVDVQVKRKALQGPFLVKLDTHGFEMPILRGAAETLKQTELLIIECYNFQIAPEAVKFWQMCAYLDSIGFSCLDMFDPMYRERDDALWQMDIVFAKSSREEFKYSRYI
ncbi:MAG: FkbM family methyltransferase [Verrucomicrobiales bacterium]|nr:FkbM family methyltransferase [Verrucomicrobiales bacterium]